MRLSRAAIVREDRERVPRAADRDIELFAVDQFRRQSGVDIDDDAIDGRALRGVGSGSVAMIDVAETIKRGAYLPAVVELQNGTPSIDGFDCSELAVGDAERPVGQRGTVSGRLVRWCAAPRGRLRRRRAGPDCIRCAVRRPS